MKFGLWRDEVEIRGLDLQPDGRCALKKRLNLEMGYRAEQGEKSSEGKRSLMDPMWLGFFSAPGLSTWINAAHLSQQVRTCHGFLSGCPPTPLFAMQVRSSPFSQESRAGNKTQDWRAKEVRKTLSEGERSGRDAKYESSPHLFVPCRHYVLPHRDFNATERLRT